MRNAAMLVVGLRDTDHVARIGTAQEIGLRSIPPEARLGASPAQLVQLAARYLRCIGLLGHANGVQVEVRLCAPGEVEDVLETVLRPGPELARHGVRL